MIHLGVWRRLTKSSERPCFVLLISGSQVRILHGSPTRSRAWRELAGAGLSWGGRRARTCHEGFDYRSVVLKRVRSSEDKVRHIRLGTSPCWTQRREPGTRQAVTGTRSRSASFLPMRDIQYPPTAAFAPCSSM